MAADEARQRKPYHSPRRAEQAIATRRAVLDAARELFIERGYAVTTVADIARRARVAVDTVYATVGRKPALLREVLETAISGSDQAVPAEQRDYVARVRDAKGARKKIETYVAALADIQPRLAPVYPTPTPPRRGARSATGGPATCAHSPPTSAPPVSCAPICPTTRSRTSSGA
jgi:AcrR family transcriptional regulator